MDELAIAIDGFFLELRDFTKRVEDDVANLKRSFEQGYSLGPHQFRERLKQLQQQTNDVETALVDLESCTSNATTLTELTNSCLLVYQTTATGVDVLEAHLRNYGYQEDREGVAPFDPMMLLREEELQKEGEEVCRLRSSLASAKGVTASKSQAPLTHYTYSDLQTQDQVRGSLGSFSTLSHDGLHCSPGTLALKKKYTAAESLHDSRPSIGVSAQDAGQDSFEFRPHQHEEKMEVDEGKGESGFQQDRPESPSSPLAKTNEATLSSTRLSLAHDHLRFGSPYRSPYKKPEKSVFTSPAKDVKVWISVKHYETLPQYLRGAVSHEDLNDALQRLHSAQPFSTTDFLSQHQLEEEEVMGNKFILQAFVKLGILVRHFRNGAMGYQLSQEWTHLTH